LATNTGSSIAVTRWSSEWLGMPQAQTASYCHDSDTARLAVAMRIGCGAAVCSCHVVVTLSGRAGVGPMLHDRQPALNHHLLGSAPKPSTAPSLLKPFLCCAR
jgi:hypothetical protein